MSPASKHPPKPRPVRPPKPPKPVRPWQRAEAGRHRSADGRFTLESDGGGRWFFTDSGELDELGLARTSGPFPTLAAAKAAADGARDRPAAASPLAARLAEAASRPRREAPRATADPAPTAADPAAGSDVDAGSAAAGEPPVPPEPGPQSFAAGGPRAEAAAPRTWLDDLAVADRDAAVSARRLIDALEREGIPDADAVVRRDLLGGTPAIATRLLARDVLAALGRLRDPSAAAVAEAVAAALAASPRRSGLPGWRLVEHDGPGGQVRGLRLTAADLLAAAGDDHD